MTTPAMLHRLRRLERVPPAMSEVAAAQVVFAETGEMPESPRVAEVLCHMLDVTAFMESTIPPPPPGQEPPGLPAWANQGGAGVDEEEAQPLEEEIALLQHLSTGEQREVRLHEVADLLGVGWRLVSRRWRPVRGDPDRGG